MQPNDWTVMVVAPAASMNSLRRFRSKEEVAPTGTSLAEEGGRDRPPRGWGLPDLPGANQTPASADCGASSEVL